MARHGFALRREDNQPRSQFIESGKFGRLFPNLRPLTPSIESLDELGKAMVDINGAEPGDPEGATNPDPTRDNATIPAGYTYLGQFIDHDITFDPTTLKEVQVDPLSVQNFRTPALDLDSIYGSGPVGQPFLYQLDVGDPKISDPDQFLIGSTTKVANPQDTIESKPNDIPRAVSTLALTSDPRNDENLIVAQLHITFLKFHNKVVQGIKNGSIKQESPLQQTPFDEARDLVIWHYQWIVLNDFLRRILDTEQLDLVVKQGRSFYRPRAEAFIPVEFSAAAYRLGHSMIRSVYDYNRIFSTDRNSPGFITPATLQLLFEFTAKSGDQNTPGGPGIGPKKSQTLPSNWIIDWRRFFELEPAVKVNFSRKLDPFLADPLAAVPNIPEPRSLAARNLRRGSSLGLPSGQSVARFLRFEPLKSSEIAQGPDGIVAKKLGFDIETPLWYYILKEAQVQADGKHLGKVGSRIIAEVFVGLLQLDSSSFLAKRPNWRPTLPAKVPGTFTMADLLNFVGDLNPIGDQPTPSSV